MRPGSRLAVMVILGLALLTGEAQAEPPSTNRESFWGQAMKGARSFAQPVLGRFRAESGPAFVLDQSGGRPLLRFEGSPEVWVLNVHYAPRGDLLFKNDQGRTLIRASRVGGLTLFTPDHPTGVAAAFTGSAPPLRLTATGAPQLLRLLASSSARASRAAERLIPIDADSSPTSAALVADTASVAAEAMVRLARNPKTRSILGQIKRIYIREGKQPLARLRDGTLQIDVVPTQGLAGRPSSDRIVGQLGGR